ncbi:MAG: RNA-guided endonuclease InsQ/TnpB family protein [Promethearchaeota archaeon]
METHQISKNHELFDFCDRKCYESKNLYNKVNYIMRQRFTESEGYKKENFNANYYAMSKEFRKLDEAKVMASNFYEPVVKLVSKDWKSFFKSIKDWKKNPDKYNGKPNLPGYVHYKEKGRKIAINRKLNRRKDGTFKFSGEDVYFEPQTKNKIKQARIVPSNNHVDRIEYFNLEIVYEKEVKEINEREERIAGIDLNKNNLAVIGTNKKIKPIMINGKPLLSMGNYYLKKRKKLMSYVGDRGASNRIRKLDKKYKNKVEDYLHKASRYIVDWCLEKDIDTIVIGKNKGLKQEINIGKRNNFHFTIVPHATLIEQIKYKANDEGIKVEVTEESYTSKCSFLDGDELPDEYDGKDREWSGRRIKRGLYKASDGTLINADLNGAYNIIRKVYPDKIDNTNVYKHPKKINL